MGAACHLRRAFPRRRLVILEARNESGGTWSLFRYPGVRSDSDMFTLGYRFRPWTGGTAIADGRSILSYLRDTAAEGGVDRDIRFGHRVVAAAWDSSTQWWSVTARVADGGTVMMTASFLLCCSGYYRHDRGHVPDFPPKTARALSAGRIRPRSALHADHLSRRYPKRMRAFLRYEPWEQRLCMVSVTLSHATSIAARNRHQRSRSFP
ncbi:hypothetical protein [Nocardia africana]